MGPKAKSGDKKPRNRISKWYKADDEPNRLARKRNVKNASRTARLRKSIKAGTVLILLAGRFRGKRVVFLK